MNFQPLAKPNIPILLHVTASFNCIVVAEIIICKNEIYVSLMVGL